MAQGRPVSLRPRMTDPSPPRVGIVTQAWLESQREVIRNTQSIPRGFGRMSPEQ